LPHTPTSIIYFLVDGFNKSGINGLQT